MRQAVHIFKKDVRYLRWELLALVGLLGVFVYLARLAYWVDEQITSLLLGSIWAFVCARLIQAEAIPGDRQFWTTRPYAWRSLLGAKLLFVAVCLGVPFLLADAVVLYLQGFSVLTHIPGLLWSAVLITFSLLIPFCVLATLTGGITQWALTMFVGGFAVLISTAPMHERSGGADWINESGIIFIELIGASMVLLLQYSKRRKGASVVLFVLSATGAVCYWDFVPSTLAFEIETRLSKPKSDPSAIQIAFGSADRGKHEPPSYPEASDALIEIPVNFSGVGEGLDVVSDQVTSTIEGDGISWRSRDSYLSHTRDGYQQRLSVDRGVLEATKGHNVRFRSTFYLTTIRKTASVKLGTTPLLVPGVGLCSVHEDARGIDDRCTTALRDPSNLLILNLGPDSQDRFLAAFTYSPLPAGMGVSPLHWYFHYVSPLNTLSILEPQAHFRRDIELASADLANYRVLRGRRI